MAALDSLVIFAAFRTRHIGVPSMKPSSVAIDHIINETDGLF